MGDDTEELRRSEARLARAQAVAHVGSWEFDLALGTLWASDEAFRIFGAVRPPDNRLPLAEVQAPVLAVHRARLDGALADLIAGTAAYDVEFELRRSCDGEVRAARSRAEVVRDASGRPTAVVGTVQDVTAERRAEAALREALACTEAANTALQASEARARMLFEHAADAILVGNARGEIIGVNARASELSGYRPEDLSGRSIEVLFAPEERQRSPLRYDLLDGGEAVVRERLLSRSDGGSVPIEMRTRRLPDGTYQAIVRDLTERRRLEEQLILEQRMDSLGTLTSGIAHDFNNILAAIVGYAGVLERDAARLAPDQIECVDNILQATSRASDLIRWLQATTRSEPASAIAFDLGAVATEVFGVLSETTDPLIAKVLVPSAEPIAVVGDPSELHRALLNLGLNAVQAIEERGAREGDEVRLTWVAHRAADDDPAGLAPGEYVHLALRDTGVGMTELVRRRAFDPLFTTKAKGARKGQGLGLTMVYRTVVDKHRGRVSLTSRPGAGTAVHIYLPRAAVAAAALPKPEVVQVEAGHATVLVVDDEPQVLRVMVRMLAMYGHEVLTATSGEEALTVFEREAARIALVVLDRTLPGCSGAAVFREIQRLRPGTAVIVSSGDLNDAPTEFPGARCLLAKPFSPTTLAAAVREALSAG